MTPKDRAMLASYLRSALSAALAVYIANPADVTWRDVLAAFTAAFVPPLIRWMNPNDAAFGRAKK